MKATAAAWPMALGQLTAWTTLYYAFAALFLAIERDTAWGKAEISLGFSLAIAAQALGAPIAGRLIDGGFARPMMTAAALIAGAAMIGLGFAGDPLAFALLWLVIGSAFAFCLYEPCFAIVTKAAGTKARDDIAVITVVSGFASMISIALGANLAGVIGWRWTTTALGATAILLAAPLLWRAVGRYQEEAERSAEFARSSPEDDQAALAAARRKPAFFLIALAFPLIGFEHAMLSSHLLPIADDRGLAPGLAIAMASTLGPTQVGGRIALLAFGRALDPIRAAQLAFAGASVASLILLLWGAAPLGAFAFAALQGASYGLISLIKPAVIADCLGRVGYGAIAGWLALPYVAGFAAAPLTGALLWRLGGYDLAIAAGAAATVSGLAALLLLERYRS